MLTKKDLLAIRRIFREELKLLRKDIQDMSLKLDRVNEKLENMEIDSNQEIFLDLMVMVKLHHKKIIELEKILTEDPELPS